MAINVARCQGCQRCAVACKMNNNLPKDHWRNRIDTDGGEYQDTARGEYPANLHKMWFAVTCQHCTMAPCVAACPTGAASIREDGIVVIDHEECIGCSTCVPACPYGVRTLNSSELEYYTGHALGDFDAPIHVNNTMDKCDFCLHRLARGEEPACMEFCPGDARHWGDMDDPDSDVSKYIAGKTTSFLLEEKGSGPNCYYIL